MLGKVILLVTCDKASSRRLASCLRGAGNDVLHAPSSEAAALIGARAVDLVLVDAQAEGALDVLAAAADRVPAVVLSTSGTPALLLDLVCARGVEHVLARSGDATSSLDDLAREAVITAEKILRGELFGVDKYLPGFGVEMSSAEVRSAGDRDDIVDCVRDHVEWLGAGREAARAAAAVVDELITNAVYDAPRDEAGRARYASLDRRHKVELDPWEHVAVRWGSDGEVLAVSVTDWFGALRPEHVRDGLRRCLGDADPIEQKAGGAGLGLYTVLAYSTQLVVNVDRGVRTEIIALVDLRRRGHGARRGGQSLHLFFDNSRARTSAETDAVPTPVAVSDSMRVELREVLAPARRRVEIVPLLRPRTASAPPVLPAPLVAPVPSDDDGLGAGTVCGLLRGARDVDAVVLLGLRFLAQHYDAVIAYRVGPDQLIPRLAVGRVRDWPRLREQAVPRDGRSTLAALTTGRVCATYRPTHPADYRLAKLATGVSEASGLAMPVSVGGEPRWVLVGGGLRVGTDLSFAELELMRHELETHMGRLDLDEPWIEVTTGVG